MSENGHGKSSWIARGHRIELFNIASYAARPAGLSGISSIDAYSIIPQRKYLSFSLEI